MLAKAWKLRTLKDLPAMIVINEEFRFVSMYFSLFTVVYRIDHAQIMVYFSEMKFPVLIDSSNSFYFHI
jgi:hypothetical protein